MHEDQVSGSRQYRRAEDLSRVNDRRGERTHRDVVSAGQTILCVEQKHPEVLLLVVVGVEEIPCEGGDGLGIVETPR